MAYSDTQNTEMANCATVLLYACTLLGITVQLLYVNKYLFQILEFLLIHLRGYDNMGK
jgi:hypothetical protein